MCENKLNICIQIKKLKSSFEMNSDLKKAYSKYQEKEEEFSVELNKKNDEIMQCKDKLRKCNISLDNSVCILSYIVYSAIYIYILQFCIYIYIYIYIYLYK